MKALLPHRLAAVAAVCVVFVHAAAPAAAAPPNLVVILADDLGWSDVGCYGGEIPTPHLDALAAGGMRFTAFYNCAQCCPTRAALLSGMDPHAAGMGDMIDGFAADIRRAAASPHYTTRLDPRALTIAERLRPAGYRTLMTGKWHVGFEDGARPLQRGFDRFYGFVGGGDDYFRPRRLVDGDAGGGAGCCVDEEWAAFVDHLASGARACRRELRAIEVEPTVKGFRARHRGAAHISGLRRRQRLRCRGRRRTWCSPRVRGRRWRSSTSRPRET
jgi:hypothetical protein